MANHCAALYVAAFFYLGSFGYYHNYQDDTKEVGLQEVGDDNLLGDDAEAAGCLAVVAEKVVHAVENDGY